MSHVLNEEEYIGDGLYVRFDGFSFYLRAPREEGDHFVALEPKVLRRLNRFVEKILKEQHERAAKSI